MKSRLIWIVAALLLAAGAGWWFWFDAKPSVTVATITRGTAAEIVYATGVVEPAHWAKVTTVVAGRIVESCNCEGLDVRKGDLLFRLDDTEMRARADEIRARLELAEKELARTSDLFERGVHTRERYDQAFTEVAKLRANLAAVESQAIDLAIRAPLDGQVLRIEGEVGEVAILGEGLAWVGRPKPLLVIAEVNEEDVPRVAIGQQALLKADAFPSQALPAVVSSITPMGDPELKTYRVRLALPEDTPVLINMTVDVNIIIRTMDDAVLAPAPALINGALQVLTDSDRIERRAVETGIAGAAQVQIVNGANPGERVVSPALDSLADGDRVQVQRGAEPASP